MSRQIIQRGSAANDGTGDSLRNAGQKINENFKELWEKLGGDSVALIPGAGFEEIGGYYAVAFEGNTIDGNKAYLFAGSPSAPRLIALPDATGVVVLTDDNSILQNKTLTDPKIVSYLMDSSDNELVDFSPVTSAVNHVGISNAVTGNDPVIEAKGDDPNIDLQILPKGDGVLKMGRSSYVHQDITASSSTVDLSKSFVKFAPSVADITGIICSDGSTTGEFIRMVNNSGTYDVDVDTISLAQGTSFTIKAKGAVDISWDGSEWFLNQDSGNNITITP